jgi:hypothetical protein
MFENDELLEQSNAPLAPLVPVLFPLAAVNLIAQRHGSPEQLRDQARAIARAARVAAPQDSLLRPGFQSTVRGNVAVVVRYLRYLRRRALLAEAFLAEAGYRYDWERQRLVERSASPGRPPTLLRHAVGLLWEVVQPWYEQRTGDRDWRAREVRDLIQAKLLFYFLPHQVGAERKGPIDNALNSYLNPPSR